MPGASAPSRLNIYLDEPTLRRTIAVAAAHDGVSLSAYCLQAIRRRLAAEGYSAAPTTDDRRAAARSLDELRQRIGPIGVPVSELIADGRRR